MDKSILIRNIDMVLPNQIMKGDIYIFNGVIKKIGAKINEVAIDRIINGDGLLLLAGIIDSHTHFREPGLTQKEDFESGSIAGVAGGVTTILDMPNTLPPTTSWQTLNEKRKIAQKKSLVNYGFYVGVTNSNIEKLNSINNIAGIKLFLGSSTGNLLIDDMNILEKIYKKSKHLIAVHAESEAMIKANQILINDKNKLINHNIIRNEQVAFDALNKIINLAYKYNKKTHVLHISSKLEIDFLATNKINNLISVEVTPHHLNLIAPECYKKYGVLAKVNPPIRDMASHKALWKGLSTGIIDTIATDHAPHLLKEKQISPVLNAPSGMPGIETSLLLMLDAVNKGKININKLSQLMSKNPAKIFGIQNKGEIKIGYDADLVLVDMKSKTKINKLYTKCGWSVFNGLTLKGKIMMTIVGGNIIFEQGKIVNNKKGKEVIFRV